MESILTSAEVQFHGCQYYRLARHWHWKLYLLGGIWELCVSFFSVPKQVVSVRCYDIATMVATLGAPKANGCFWGESWRAELSWGLSGVEEDYCKQKIICSGPVLQSFWLGGGGEDLPCVLPPLFQFTIVKSIVIARCGNQHSMDRLWRN